MDLTALYKKYDKETVDKAVAQLKHHKPDPLPKDESDEHPTLYVFRHGQSYDNLEWIFSGWRVAEVTEEGMKQALILAPQLRHKEIDLLISSPQIRAVDTMKIAICLNNRARTLPIETDERIKERDYGDLTGTSKIEYQINNPEELRQIRRSYDTPPPGGESIGMTAKRVAEFCSEIVPLMKENKINVAVSCHGNSIRGFRQFFEGLSNEETASVETPLGQDYAAYTIK